MNDAEYIAAIAEFYKDGPSPEFRAHYERLMHISAAIAAAPAQPVATIYVTEDGSREVDDWKVELPVGATTLYTAAQAQPDDQQARGTDAG